MAEEEAQAPTPAAPAEPAATVWYSFVAGGHKVSFAGPHIAQVISDIAGFFGEDQATATLERLTEAFSASLSTDQLKAMGATPIVAGGVSPQGGTVSVAPPEPPGGYEACPKCGSDKDKFVPGGVSRRTGRPYNSFWGCGNSNCR